MTPSIEGVFRGSTLLSSGFIACGLIALLLFAGIIRPLMDLLERARPIPRPSAKPHIPTETADTPETGQISCRKCGHLNGAENETCICCGHDLYVICCYCHAQNVRANRECVECGTLLRRHRTHQFIPSCSPAFSAGAGSGAPNDLAAALLMFGLVALLFGAVALATGGSDRENTRPTREEIEQGIQNRREGEAFRDFMIRHQEQQRQKQQDAFDRWIKTPTR